MSDEKPEGTEGPSPADLDRIAEACARFESAWRRGNRPRIEDSLSDPILTDDDLLENLLPLELALRIENGDLPRPDDYLERFPGSRGLVEAVFAEHSTAADEVDAPGAPPPQAGTAASGSSANLLIGILALQNGFIDHLALIAAIQAWAVDKSRRLGDVLIRTGKITPEQLALLEAVAADHRRRHGDDLQRGMAAFGSLAPVFRAVEGMGDPEIEADLTFRLASTRMEDAAETAHGDPTDAGVEGGGERREVPDSGPSASASASRFQVLSFHDAGMLGRVFIALDKELNRNVALKEIQEARAHQQTSRTQFLLEGMVTGALEHPGIVPVYSLGTREDGSPFYAMRFIQGPSLRDKIRQLHGDPEAKPPGPGEAPPTLPRLLRHFVNACQAMAYAHSRGVLHRDLKPEHVLLGPFGETLVVDWGLAMPIRAKQGGTAPGEAPLDLPPGYDSVLAEDGLVVGTLAYMSPEQARGEVSRMDRTSDVYALGAVLYAILTGRAPYQGRGGFAGTLGKVSRGEFPAPREIARDVPPALEAICLKAMRLSPSDRYETAAALAADVEHWLDDEPTLAYPEPWTIRAGRWLRRHRTAAVAAAAVLGSALIGLAGLNLQARFKNQEITRQRDLAVEARSQAEGARKQAVAARESADRNFKQSLDVIARVLLPVAAQDLAPFPGLTTLRREVADEAAGFLGGLLSQRPDDPAVCFAAAQSYRELANIERLLGPARHEPYGGAVSLLRRAAELQPDELKHRDYLAEVLLEAASSFQVEGRADGEPYLTEALALAASLRQDRPDDPAFQRTEARVDNGLAYQRILTGAFDEAVTLAESTCRRMIEFADSDDPGPTDLLEVIMYQDTMGEALLGAGRPADALTTLDDSIRRADALLAMFPDDGDLRMLKFLAMTKRATALAEIPGRRDDASRDDDLCVEGFDRLTRESPEIIHYPELLAEALLGRAERRAERNDLQAARDDLRLAAESVERLLTIEAKRPAYVALAGRVLAGLGLLDLQRNDPAAARPRLEFAAELLRDAALANPNGPVIRATLARIEPALNGAPAGAP